MQDGRLQNVLRVTNNIIVKSEGPSRDPQGPGAGRGFNELHQKVRHRQGGWGHSLDPPPCSDKSRTLGFSENQFF